VVSRNLPLNCPVGLFVCIFFFEFGLVYYDDLYYSIPLHEGKDYKTVTFCLSLTRKCFYCNVLVGTLYECLHFSFSIDSFSKQVSVNE
jgi:hypothetical protein